MALGSVDHRAVHHTDCFSYLCFPGFPPANTTEDPLLPGRTAVVVILPDSSIPFEYAFDQTGRSFIQPELHLLL